MPKQVKPLADAQCRNAKPRASVYRLYDGSGLRLEIRADGVKRWSLKYRFGGVEKYIHLGIYPTVGLNAARRARDEARACLRENIDPAASRKAAKEAAAGADNFETVAREWLAKKSIGWAESHSDKIVARLERDVFPYLGKLRMRNITAPQILTVLRRVEGRNTLETAHRVQQNVGQVFRYAVATGRADNDPTGALRGALPPAQSGHFAAPTDPREVGALLRTVEGFSGGPIVRAALRLAPLVFARPGELRMMRWADVHLDDKEWRYRVSKTKTDHIVSLSAQAVAILTDLKPLTGEGVYVFPSLRGKDKPLSDAALNAALRRLGVAKDHFTMHGWRVIARTLLHERLGWRPEVIEHQLAHSVPDALGTAYNRTKFLADRKEMLQQWADYLGRLAVETNVVAGNFGRAA